MIYIRAGLFAEGPTDYAFLLPLLDRLLEALGASELPGAYEVAPSMGIDAPSGAEGSRAEKIAAAILDHWDQCTLFVIHSDGAGDPQEAQRLCVAPGILAARTACPERSIVAVGCVPVRETEAWMLADTEILRSRGEGGVRLSTVAEPERELDPKRTLRRLVEEAGLRRPQRLYALFGERGRLEALRTIPSFRAFQADLEEALRQLGRA